MRSAAPRSIRSGCGACSSPRSTSTLPTRRSTCRRTRTWPCDSSCGWAPAPHHAAEVPRQSSGRGRLPQGPLRAAAAGPGPQAAHARDHPERQGPVQYQRLRLQSGRADADLPRRAHQHGVQALHRRGGTTGTSTSSAQPSSGRTTRLRSSGRRSADGGQIKAKIWELVSHRGWRCRYHGDARSQCQLLLTVTVVNGKRLTRLLCERVQPP